MKNYAIPPKCLELYWLPGAEFASWECLSFLKQLNDLFAFIKGWRCVWVSASPTFYSHGRLHLLWAGNLLHLFVLFTTLAKRNKHQMCNVNSLKHHYFLSTQSIVPLVESLKLLSGPETCIICCYEQRTEGVNPKVERQFFKVRAYPFMIHKYPKK